MRCDRCGGLRLWSHFENLEPSAGAWAYEAWRCMNCGDVVDTQILLNRALQQPPEEAPHRARPFGGNIVWLRPREAAPSAAPPRRPGSGRLDERRQRRIAG